MTRTEILQFVNVALAGIAAGGLLFILVVVIPTRATLPFREAIQLHLVSSRLIDRYMPASVILASFTAILLLIPGLHDVGALSIGLVAVGLCGSMSIGLLSVAVLFPLNRRIAQWATDTRPAEYHPLFGRWNRWHALRTAGGVVALAGYLSAALIG